MTYARNIAVFTVTLSLLTFVAFFGRLPAFRHTPIGFLHRLLVVHIPSSLRRLDVLLTRGRITHGSVRLGRYLMYKSHPVVVVFFLGLVTASSALFIPMVWGQLGLQHRLLVPIILPLPYLFTYLSATSSTKAYINHRNHAAQMRLYPYDRILFYPGTQCSTCNFLKPARSKHCSICKTCVARMDHHCIWVNNCLGRGNYRWFLALLLSTGIMLAYGAYLAYIVITPRVNDHYAKYETWYRYKPKPFVDSSSWSTYFGMKLHHVLNFTSIYLEVGGVRESGVGLLALLTWPLPLALLVYHIYLIWAGMTTNESGKWADWRDDMAEGVVFLGCRREETMPEGKYVQTATTPLSFEQHSEERTCATPSSTSTLPLPPSPEKQEQEDEDEDQEEPLTTWPLVSRHILIRTADGHAPQNLPSRIRSVADEGSFKRVWDLGAVENVYDLGFWDNLLEALQ